MRKQTFTEGSATITVREEIGSDVWDEEIVQFNLGDAIVGHPLMRVEKFVAAVVRSEAVQGLDFVWPQGVTDVANMATAYEAWRKLPRALLKRWDIELSAVNIAPGDPDLQPLPDSKP